jgi:hypothetical protein
MDREQLVRDFIAILDDFAKQQKWGEINVTITGGVPTLISTTINRKLNSTTGAANGRIETRTR